MSLCVIAKDFHTFPGHCRKKTVYQYKMPIFLTAIEILVFLIGKEGKHVRKSQCLGWKHDKTCATDRPDSLVQQIKQAYFRALRFEGSLW